MIKTVILPPRGAMTRTVAGLQTSHKFPWGKSRNFTSRSSDRPDPLYGALADS